MAAKPDALSEHEPINNLQLSDAQKACLLSKLWDSGPLAESVDIAAYFSYYAHQCDSFVVEQDHIAHSSLDPTAAHIRTHLGLVDVATTLLKTGLDRGQVLTKLMADNAQAGVSETMVESSINWAARLVTVMEIGELNCAVSSRRPLLWQDGSVLNFVAEHFKPRKFEASYVRLERLFNAVNIERLGGVEIHWTNDLASHLSLRDDDTKLLLFHHATFLLMNRNDIFPPGFVDETLRTLALLLPAGEGDTREWFRKQQALHLIDPRAVECGRLRADDRRIETFHFWRERLSVLKQVFDEAEPKTLYQWWYDRRRGPQWYTFWVAILVLALTIFFGLVQCIEGALQVYKSW